MYDITADLQVFYDEFVRLGSDRRKMLAGYRDTNVQRIKDGLDDLSEDTGNEYRYPREIVNQGGYAMHTLNQATDNEYDIDVGLVFDKADLPSDPLRARQLICDALLKSSDLFSKEPEVRTNAVTVWYAEGYHIDFAIYRRSTDFLSRIQIEHASTEWKPRNPSDVTDWFAKQVEMQSPKPNYIFGTKPKVADAQLRRVVRLLKWFCRSRTSWSLPGGMIISTLAAEVYRPDSDRDDVALYSTMIALRSRLGLSTRVYSPVVSGEELTAKDENHNEVIRLRDKLGTVLEKMAVLSKADCTYEQARSAWDWVFNHAFWTKDNLRKTAASTASSPYAVNIRCDLAKRHEGPTYRNYRSASYVLPKGIALKFTVASTNVPKPYTIRWTANNEGDEAKEAGQETWQRTGDTCWTSTRYRGNQRMTCQIEKDGRPLAKSTHYVKISSGGKWFR